MNVYFSYRRNLLRAQSDTAMLGHSATSGGAAKVGTTAKRRSSPHPLSSSGDAAGSSTSDAAASYSSSSHGGVGGPDVRLFLDTPGEARMLQLRECLRMESAPAGLSLEPPVTPLSQDTTLDLLVEESPSPPNQVASPHGERTPSPRPSPSSLACWIEEREEEDGDEHEDDSTDREPCSPIDCTSTDNLIVT